MVELTNEMTTTKFDVLTFIPELVKLIKEKNMPIDGEVSIGGGDLDRCKLYIQWNGHIDNPIVTRVTFSTEYK